MIRFNAIIKKRLLLALLRFIFVPQSNLACADWVGLADQSFDSGICRLVGFTVRPERYGS